MFGLFDGHPCIVLMNSPPDRSTQAVIPSRMPTFADGELSEWNLHGYRGKRSVHSRWGTRSEYWENDSAGFVFPGAYCTTGDSDMTKVYRVLGSVQAVAKEVGMLPYVRG